MPVFSVIRRHVDWSQSGESPPCANMRGSVCCHEVQTPVIHETACEAREAWSQQHEQQQQQQQQQQLQLEVVVEVRLR
jgi:hypothetical protein